MRCQTYGYLPSLGASPPFDRYQIILLGDRGTRVWTTCLRLLPGSVLVRSRTCAPKWPQDYKSSTLPLDYRATQADVGTAKTAQFCFSVTCMHPITKYFLTDGNELDWTEISVQLHCTNCTKRTDWIAVSRRSVGLVALHGPYKANKLSIQNTLVEFISQSVQSSVKVTSFAAYPHLNCCFPVWMRTQTHAQMNNWNAKT